MMMLIVVLGKAQRMKISYNENCETGNDNTI